MRNWALYYVYGLDAAKQIASDVAKGQANGVAPLEKADTFVLGELCTECGTNIALSTGMYSCWAESPFLSQ